MTFHPRLEPKLDENGEITHKACVGATPCLYFGDELQPREAFTEKGAPGRKTRLHNRCKACLLAAGHAKKDAIYGADRPKKMRKVATDRLDDEIIKFAEEFRPVSCRQIYYGLVSLRLPDGSSLIGKSEKAYEKIVDRAVVLRENGRLEYGWIVDHTRSIRRPNMYAGIVHMLECAAGGYRLDPWEDQDCRIQIWLEKDALVDVFYGITAEYGVPLLVARGYSSATFVKKAADEINADDKPMYVYYFGDHDPSGWDARRDVREKLEMHGCKLAGFKDVAVTPDQIDSEELSTRETKLNDKRAPAFMKAFAHIHNGESVDIDAIHPTRLREMISDCITQHIDQAEWDATLEKQEEEKSKLDSLADKVEDEGVESLDEFLST